ncbi:MAG: UbiA family prenyltransferase [Candidatus Micrarchaeota archaeon]|nr:UbiA family prenyltransferase [Candidatus Micrarchaeota archaeon]
MSYSQNSSNLTFLLNAFFKLVRIEHALMYAVAVLIGAIIVGGISALTTSVLLAALVSILLEFGAFALNDYVDLRADKINRRTDRPLVTGEISPRAALFIGLFSFVFANVIALFYLPTEAFFIILLFTFLSLAYDLMLKNTPLIGNAIIALTMAVPFFFGAFVYALESKMPSFQIQPVICLSGIAFFVGLGREIMKDIEDMKGDKYIGGKTLPILIGKKNSAKVVAVFFIFSIVLSFIPMFTFFSGKILYLLVLITDFMLFNIALHILRDQSVQSLRNSRKSTLLAIGIGLLAFLLGSL